MKVIIKLVPTSILKGKYAYFLRLTSNVVNVEIFDFYKKSIDC